MSTQVMEAIEAPDDLSVQLLKQKREALKEKGDLLKKLDEEIIEFVEEDKLEEEIEAVDQVQEKIELTLMHIEMALSGRRTPLHKSPTPTRALAPHHESTSHRGSPPGSHHSSRGPSPSGSECSSVKNPVDCEGDTHSRGRVTPPHAIISTEDSTATGTAAGLHVKLPKLSLKKFGGDLTKWMTFWDTFESSVHNNPSLSKIDKFNYLNSLLESAAAESIAGLTLTSVNYDEAVATLKRRFGNKQLIVNRHMEILLNLESVCSHHHLKSLRHLMDVVEANVRGLQALGVPTESYGGLLSSILMSKLPSELRLIVTRELSDKDWELDSLMRIIEREVDAREESSGGLTATTRKTNPRTLPTAMSLINNSHAGKLCLL